MVRVDNQARVDLTCSQVVQRYEDFVQRGIEPGDGVIPNDAWTAACRDEISDRKAWAWPAVVVGAVALLGTAIVRRP